MYGADGERGQVHRVGGLTSVAALWFPAAIAKSMLVNAAAIEAADGAAIYYSAIPKTPI